MRVTKKEIKGIKVQGWKDAGDWKVQAGDMTTVEFNSNTWTLKEAMEFCADTAVIHKEMAA